METLRVLGLFEGLGGASLAFRERGHEVVGVDNNEDIAAMVDQDSYRDYIVADVRDLDAAWLVDEYGPFDVVWWSFPCQTFSVLTISNYWTKDGTPKPGLCRERIRLVEHTLQFVDQELNPRVWIAENPLGMARKLECWKPYERRTVTYCQYGMPYRKATDLWGGFPGGLQLRRPCSPGALCHQAQPRDKSKVGGYHAIRDVDARELGAPHRGARSAETHLRDSAKAQRERERERRRRTGAVADLGGGVPRRRRFRCSVRPTRRSRDPTTKAEAVRASRPRSGASCPTS